MLIAAQGQAGRIHSGGRSSVKYDQSSVVVPHHSMTAPPQSPVPNSTRSRRGSTFQQISAAMTTQMPASNQSMPPSRSTRSFQR